MSLKMSSPIEINGRWHLSVRVPKDLLSLKGGFVVLPIDGRPQKVSITDMVRVSLRTSERDVAARRFVPAHAALLRFWGEARQKTNRDGRFKITSATDYLARTEALAADALDRAGLPTTEAAKQVTTATLRANMDDIYAAIGLLSPVASSKSLSIDALFEKYSSAMTEAGALARATIDRYSSTVGFFSKDFGKRDVRLITSAEVLNWAKERAKVVSARTVNANDLAALKSVFNWATSLDAGKLLPNNIAEGIRVREPRKVEAEPEKGFSPEQAAKILNASMSETDVDPKNPTLSYAKRWCPWLCAYSGSRISEITALHAEDIQKPDGIWSMYVFHTKTGKKEYVPIHNHVIEQGFINFVASVDKGPLFYDCERHTKVNAKNQPATIKGHKLAKWIHSIVKIQSAQQPNHGWRHTFATRAIDYMPERVSNAITGHKDNSASGIYRRPSVRQMAKWLVKFPKYDLNPR